MQPEETRASFCAQSLLQGPSTASRNSILQSNAHASGIVTADALSQPSLLWKKKNSFPPKTQQLLPRPACCRAHLPHQQHDPDSIEEDAESSIEASLLELQARAASLDATLSQLALRSKAARGAREAQRDATAALVRACEVTRGEWRAEARLVAEFEAASARDRAAEAEAEALRCALAAARAAAAGAGSALVAADARADGLRRQLAEFELEEGSVEEEEEMDEEGMDVSAAVGASFGALAEAVEAASAAAVSRRSEGDGESGGSVAVAQGGGGGSRGTDGGNDSAPGPPPTSSSSSPPSPSPSFFLSPSLPGGRGVLASAALSAHVPLNNEGGEEEEEKEKGPTSLTFPGPSSSKHHQPPRPSILRRAGLTGVALAAALRGALAAYRFAREAAGPRGSRARAAVDVAAAAAVAAAALWLAAI